MSLYLDIHKKFDGATAEAVAEAHAKDVEVQGKFGVQYDKYWMDESSGTIFCLAHLERSNVHLQTGESMAALAEARESCLASERCLQEAADYFRQAVTHWQSIKRSYDQVRALASLGDALKSMGDTTAATEAYKQAAKIFDSLATQLDLERLGTFLNSHPVREVRQALEAVSPTSLPKETRQEPSLLTEREIEVLMLVAEGLTNAQIAEQLVLSPLTVNAHLRSIFNKLEVANRTAAVHQARELGLV